MANGIEIAEKFAQYYVLAKEFESTLKAAHDDDEKPAIQDTLDRKVAELIASAVTGFGA